MAYLKAGKADIKKHKGLRLVSGVLLNATTEL
jgi:hypothetical protein